MGGGSRGAGAEEKREQKVGEQRMENRFVRWKNEKKNETLHNILQQK